MSSSSSQSSFDIQGISELPSAQLVAVIAEQQRVIDKLSQERDALKFKLSLDEAADELVGHVKGFLKGLYRSILNRLTGRLYRQMVKEMYAEMNRINLQHLDFQTYLTQQVADEFALMHRTIDGALKQMAAANSGSQSSDVRTLDPLVVEKLRRVEELLGYTEYRVDFNPHLPKETGRFPLKLLAPGLKETYKKIINYLFKEQRQVNINLLQALQQSYLANQHLAEQVSALQSRLDQLSPGEMSATGTELEEQSGNSEPLFNSLDH